MFKILLLEDSPQDAEKFSNKHNSETVIVTIASSVSEFFHALTNDEFDLIVIDPFLSGTIDFAKLLKETKRHNTEIMVVHPGKYIPDYLMTQANNEDISVFSMADQNKIVEIIQEFVKSKSSGQTYRIIKNETGLEFLTQEVRRQGDRINCVDDKINQTQSKLNEMTKNQDSMKTSLSKIEDSVKGLLSRNPNIEMAMKKYEEGTKRIGLYLGLVTAMIGLLSAIGVAMVPVLVKWLEQPPEPKENPRLK